MMGCGQKAVAEDEDEWDEFKRDHNLLDTRWVVYSPESVFAREGYREHSFTGIILEKYVSARTEFYKAQDAFRNKLELLQKIRDL